MINPLDLTGKHILITGASSGIGKATAIHISKLGAKISMISRNENKLKTTYSELEGTGHLMLPYDLMNINGIDEVIKKVITINGPLNGLVHCAGIAEMRPLSMTTTDFLHNMLLINFYAFVELVRCASKKNNYANGASFIGISSVESKLGDKSKTAYCASKAAMDAAVRCMAKELATKHIRVNTIIGGFVKTEMYDHYVRNVGIDAFNHHVLSKQYLGLGEPMDFANAIAFLLSDASRFITGSGLIVDGGYLS